MEFRTRSFECFIMEKESSKKKENGQSESGATTKRKGQNKTARNEDRFTESYVAQLNRFQESDGQRRASLKAMKKMDKHLEHESNMCKVC